MAEQICRFLRVLEYLGTREDLAKMREDRGVKSFRSALDGRVKIFEGILGDTDQPIIGQLKLWCMQQVSAVAVGRVYPDNDSMRDGYAEAVHDVLRLILT